MHTLDAVDTLFFPDTYGNLRDRVPVQPVQEFPEDEFEEERVAVPDPVLPDLDLPQSDLDLTMTFESILSEVTGKTSQPEE